MLRVCGWLRWGGGTKEVKMPLVSACLPVIGACSPRLTLSSHTGLI